MSDELPDDEFYVIVATPCTVEGQVCEYVYFQLPEAREDFDSASEWVAARTKVICESLATKTIDRGEWSLYEKFHGVTHVCDVHEKNAVLSANLQRALKLGIVRCFP